MKVNVPVLTDGDPIRIDLQVCPCVFVCLFAWDVEEPVFVHSTYVHDIARFGIS